MLKKDDNLIATCRVRFLDGFAKLERMAIKSNYRGQGIGSILINKVEEFVIKKNIQQIKIHAQVQAKGFYQSNGYSVISEKEFMEDGIKHIKMNKKL